MIKKNEKTFLGIDLSGDPGRANYIARIFAIFYEDLLEVCLEKKGFTSNGRPSVYNKKNKYLRKTYDYTLEKNGEYFIVEAKSYLAFNNFEYLELTAGKLKKLLDNWGDKDNFTFFCKLGSKKEPYKKYQFYYDNPSEKYFSPDGKILVWPKVEKSNIDIIKRKYNFSNIFSIEDAIKDMVQEVRHGSRKSENYSARILRYKKWTEELFKALV